MKRLLALAALALASIAPAAPATQAAGPWAGWSCSIAWVSDGAGGWLGVVTRCPFRHLVTFRCPFSTLWASTVSNTIPANVSEGSRCSAGRADRSTFTLSRY